MFLRPWHSLTAALNLNVETPIHARLMKLSNTIDLDIPLKEKSHCLESGMASNRCEC